MSGDTLATNYVSRCSSSSESLKPGITSVNNFQPEAYFVQAPNCVQDGLQPPAELMIVAVIKALQINSVEVDPGSQILKHLRSAVSVGDKGRQQSCRTG